MNSLTKWGTRVSVTVGATGVNVLAEGHGYGYGFTIPVKAGRVVTEADALGVALEQYVAPMERYAREKIEAAVAARRTDRHRKRGQWVHIDHPRTRTAAGIAINDDGTFRVGAVPEFARLTLEQAVEYVVWGNFLYQYPYGR